MIQFKKKMCSGQTCTGEKGDKRCQLGRASSELLMAALFRFSLSSLSCYFLSSLCTYPQLTFDIWSTSFIPRLSVFPERMRVGTMPLLTTGWGYVSNIHPPVQIRSSLYCTGPSDPACGFICGRSKGSSCKDCRHRRRCHHVTW